jgi:hypothetical protein
MGIQLPRNGILFKVLFKTHGNMCDHHYLSMERPYPCYFIILLPIGTVDKRGGTIRDTYFY